MIYTVKRYKKGNMTVNQICEITMCIEFQYIESYQEGANSPSSFQKRAQFCSNELRLYHYLKDQIVE